MLWLTVNISIENIRVLMRLSSKMMLLRMVIIIPSVRGVSWRHFVPGLEPYQVTLNCLEYQEISKDSFM